MKNNPIDFRPDCWIHHWTTENRFYIFLSSTSKNGFSKDNVEITEDEAKALSWGFGVEIVKSLVFGGGRK